MRSSNDFKTYLLDLTKPISIQGVHLTIKSKRADLRIDKRFQGILVIKNINEKNQLRQITINPGSQSEIIAITSYRKPGDYLTKIKLKKDAKSRYNLLAISRAESTQKYQFQLSENAQLETAILDIDTASKIGIYETILQKNNSSILFEHALFANENQKKTISITHHNQGMQTQAHMFNYGVVFERADVVIEGIGRMDKGSIQSNNQQKTQLLVLGEQAKAVARPLLYIKENDVQAGHAMSVGTFDEDTLFYLLSRGLSEKEAKHYLILGLFQPVLLKISDKKIQKKMVEYLQGVIE